MKKIPLFILCAFIILIAIGFIPFSQQVAVKINASYFNCYQQLFNAEGWQNWYPDIKNKQSSVVLINSPNVFELNMPGGTVLARKQSSSALFVVETYNKKTYDYTLTAVPDIDQLNTTLVVTSRTNVINYIISIVSKDEVEQTNIERFKNYMEDASQYYGFDIKPGFVEEKKILVKSKVVLQSGIYVEAATMQTDLHDFIKLKHLKQQGPVIAQFIPKLGDSVQVMIGIPINEKISTPSGFTYMYMPPSRAIVADYKGEYRHKNKIYAALGRYMQDKFQHPKIAPFEEFADGMPADSSEVVSFKLNYLIF